MKVSAKPEARALVESVADHAAVGHPHVDGPPSTQHYAIVAANVELHRPLRLPTPAPAPCANVLALLAPLFAPLLAPGPELGGTPLNGIDPLGHGIASSPGARAGVSQAFARPPACLVGELGRAVPGPLNRTSRLLHCLDEAVGQSLDERLTTAESQ